MDICGPIGRLDFDVVEQGVCMARAGTGIDNGHRQHRHGQIWAKVTELCKVMWSIWIEEGQQLGCCTVSVLASLFPRSLFTSYSCK